MSTRIYLIRHGRQSDTRCNVDVDLSAEGREQARLVGARIATWNIERLYASTLHRALETARIIDEKLGIGVLTRQAINEINFGTLEGKTDDEISGEYGDFQKRQALMEVDLQYPGGENISQVLERSRRVFDEIVNSGLSSVAVITHGGVIRAMASYATQAPMARWRNIAKNLENGSITELVATRRADNSINYRLERLNDYAHLEMYPELLRAAWGVSEN